MTEEIRAPVIFAGAQYFDRIKAVMEGIHNSKMFGDYELWKVMLRSYYNLTQHHMKEVDKQDILKRLKAVNLHIENNSIISRRREIDPLTVKRQLENQLEDIEMLCFASTSNLLLRLGGMDDTDYDADDLIERMT